MHAHLMQTLDLTFRLRDRGGSVHVDVWPNEDPDDLGHSLVAVGYDDRASRGFPCAKATIEYDGDGPRAGMGWLQVIARHDGLFTSTHPSWSFLDRNFQPVQDR